VKFRSGTVYSRALAIFLAASLLLLGTTFTLTQTIILQEIGNSEQREMKATLMRFSLAFARETQPTQIALVAWSRSPGIGAFLTSRDRSASPLNSNLEALQSLNCDFVAAYDAAGNLIQEKVINPDLPESLRDFSQIAKLFPTATPATDAPAESLETGFALLENQLTSLSLKRVYDKQGRLLGSFVAGRVLVPQSWRYLDALFSANVRFFPFEETTVSESTGRELADLLNQNELVVNADRADQIVGLRLVRGLNDRPLGYIRIAQPRVLRQEALGAIYVFLVGISLAGGSLVFVVWILLDRTVLARITSLTEKLNTEIRSGRLPVKLDFRGADELAILARRVEDLAQTLQNTQSQYRAVVEDQTEWIVRFDADLNIAFANQIFLRRFGIENQPLTGRRLDEFLAEGSRHDFTARFQRLTPGHSISTYTHEVALPSGPSLWMRSTLRGSFSDSGECLGGQWVAADVSAQVEAQRRMIESERRFRRLFETSSDGVLLLNSETLEISDVNSSLCTMLLLQGSELMGRHLTDFPTFLPCVEPVERCRAAEPRSGHTNALKHECSIERSDHSVAYVELRVSGYQSDEKSYIQISFRNISDRVKGDRELRQLSARLLHLQDEERRRIARELHDSTAQNLSAIEINMSLLEPLLAPGDGRADRIVAETRALAGECSRELRNVSYLLHPPLIDEVGLLFAVKWFADGFEKRTGISVNVDIDPTMPRLSPDLEMPLFRVVQEAMTNIYRHAGADRAWIILQRTRDDFSLEVRDNGRGFPNEKRSEGVGLAGMRERIANLGGRLEVDSSTFGVRVMVRLHILPEHEYAVPS